MTLMPRTQCKVFFLSSRTWYRNNKNEFQ